ncbi:MAG: hypothetical protein RH982_12050 [Parvibaculum sp.]
MTPARDNLARILMIILGIASLGAFANAAVEFDAVGPEQVNVEAWRMFAFPVFGGLFVLLGLFPRRIPGIWELVFYHKAGVAFFLAFFVEGGTADGASFGDNAAVIILVDLLLAGTTVFCYLLTKGYRAWLPASRAGAVDA